MIKSSKLIKVLSISVLILTFLFLSQTLYANTVELDLWTFVDGHAEYFETMAEEYNKQNEDVDLVLNTSVYPLHEMHDQIAISLETGAGVPDLMDINHAFFYDIIDSYEDDFLDLTDLMNKYEGEIVDARRLLFISESGKVYGVPTHMGTAVIYYDKTVFEEAGLDLEYINNIETWDDYVEAGKIIKEETGKWMTGVQTNDWWSFNMMTRQFGSNFFDEDYNVNLNRPENVRVLEFLQDLVHEHEIADSITNYENPNVINRFNSKEFASWLPYPQWFNLRFYNFMPDLEGDIVMRPIPNWEGGNSTRSAMGGGTGTAIWKETSNPEVAKEFLEFAKLTEDATIKISKELGFDPIRLSAYDRPELNEPDPFFNNEKIFNTIRDLQSEIQPAYFAPGYQVIREYIEEEVLHQAIEGERDPEELLNEVAESIKNELNQ